MVEDLSWMQNMKRVFTNMTQNVHKQKKNGFLPSDLSHKQQNVL
jgi:hypothetical protein